MTTLTTYIEQPGFTPFDSLSELETLREEFRAVWNRASSKVGDIWGAEVDPFLRKSYPDLAQDIAAIRHTIDDLRGDDLPAFEDACRHWACLVRQVVWLFENQDEHRLFCL